MIVLGVNAALRSEAVDYRVKGAFAGEREIEKGAGLVGLGLRADQPGRHPRSFKAEAPTLEDGDLDASEASRHAIELPMMPPPITRAFTAFKITARWGG
jgi:hypothetical protein